MATFRVIAKKYPWKAAKEIFSDLVANSQGNERKWFAVCREAIELANWTPCDPKTLTRAARDMKGKDPLFAVEARITALRWLIAGYGYEITSLDVLEAYSFTMEAAANVGCREETLERIKNMVATDKSGDRFVSKTLGPELGMSNR